MNEAIPAGFKPYPVSGEFIDRAGPFYYGGNDGTTYFYGFRPTAGHNNIVGATHGGALVTFADTAMSSAVAHSIKRPCATVSMTSDFVAAARPGDWIVATVTLVRQTRSLAFVRCELHAEGILLFTASGVWRVFRNQEIPPGLPDFA